MSVKSSKKYSVSDLKKKSVDKKKMWLIDSSRFDQCLQDLKNVKVESPTKINDVRSRNRVD